MQRLCLFVSLATLTLAMACKKSESADVVVDARGSGFAAVCDLFVGANAGLCIDYAADNAANQSDCNSAEFTRYVSQGINSAQYLAISGGGVSTSCAGMNPVSVISGNCALSSHTIRYYSNVWNATAAQSDCMSLSGNWSP